MLKLADYGSTESATRYPKIYNPFKRSPDGREVLVGEWARPEFAALAHSRWSGTEKLDGTNLRVTWDALDGTLNINGRGENSQIPGDLREALVERFTNEDLWGITFPDLVEKPCIVTLYGEGIGAGIQKGGLYSAEKKFVLFDVRVNNLWLRQEDVTTIADSMAIPRAPLLGVLTLVQWMAFARVEFPSALPGADPNKMAEGVMCRPVGNFLTRTGERIICKVKTEQVTEAVFKWATSAKP